MKQVFKIYIDQIHDGKTLSFDKYLSKEDFEIEDEENLIFEKPFHLKLKAYLADDLIIINYDVNFYVKIHCSICNELTEIEHDLKNQYFTKEVSSISLCFNPLEEIKSSCLIEIPPYVECKNNCPSREDIKKYFKKEDNKHFPFSKIEE
ncbi:MAG: hypothetical protein A3F40_01105 [Chlamydiae bacterium RIFCSPHIGHO2_12_FULL_27_8]|nr:MAG: hypothetical protein A3F40_01105 [Chlamydiae bacterium RIFCSPHIGHO2_12_FULL_27_8]OGN65427.1 MAG: hypothetical protein A2888_02030 [Chlamydiae bacterium RIFCSPLOWO2_01_FULL_28_7]